MKTFAIFVGCAGMAFVAMGYQLGVFDPIDDDAATGVVDGKAPATATKPPLRFPEDLLPAARWQPVPQAAEYKPAAGPHPLIFFRTNGSVHDWQEFIDTDWRAGCVEKTELVVVVGNDKETFLSIQYYPNNAPPVSRYKYEVDIAVISARTGRVLAHQPFVSMPRAIRQVEAWELTKIGQPVSFRTVYSWVTANAQTGFKN